MQKNIILKNVTGKTHQRGQTLIEIIIATGIIALVMTSIVAVITVSVKNTAEAKAKSVATKYAQEAMEFFRAQRTLLGWETFVAGLPANGAQKSYCMVTVPSLTTQYTSIVGRVCDASRNADYVDVKRTFLRQADLQMISSDQVNVTVHVDWQDGAFPRTEKIVQEFHRNVN
jgi:Tfp pilus assembly protein PilV